MQQRMILIAISIFLTLLVSICNAGELYQAEIIKISDADSIWIRMQGIKTKLNVIGIDAPEEFKSRKLRRDSKRCHIAQKHIRKLGRIATRFARSILSKGEIVKIKIYKRGKRQMYGAIYLSNGRYYSEELVRQGYACVSDGVEKKELNKLKELLDKAKKGKKGLWKKYSKIMECLCGQTR